MQETFKKIIEKLENYKSITGINTIGSYCQTTLLKAIEIVKQEAEKFGTDTNVGSNGWIPVEEELPKQTNTYFYHFQIFQFR